MKKAIRGFSGLISAVLVFVLALGGAVNYFSPSELTVNIDDSSEVGLRFPLSLRYSDDGAVSVSAEADNGTAGQKKNARLMLFGSVPVKEVSVSFDKRQYVIPGGTPFGIRLYTDGLVVSGVSEVMTDEGEKNPAAEADIRKGDIILSADGVPLTTNEQFAEAVKNSGGKAVSIKVKRNSRTFTANAVPKLSSDDGEYHLGVYIRDSCAGIGTMTCIDPDDGSFVGLGHGICDLKSGRIMPLLNGDIVGADIVSVRKSTSGAPGSLCGCFSEVGPKGIIFENKENGVSGKLYNVPENYDTIPVAFRQEVTTGKAVMRTTIDDTGPQDYEIEITSISYNGMNRDKNMVIKVTDKRLIEETGGIVQGMSGSPIIQNGRLAGAVTHVFVNDPACGYAVFAENMSI